MQTLRILATLLLLTTTGFTQNAEALRQEAQAARRNGNHLDAYNLYTQYIYEVTADAKAIAGDAPEVIGCLVNLNRDNETDAVREQLAATHADQWRVLQAVARSYQQANAWGFLIAGEFERGHHRGGGEWVSSAERDRVRALQLMAQALPLLADEPNAADAAQFHLDFAAMLLQGRGQRGAWQLAVLTDLAALPDYDKSASRWGHFGGADQSRGAPVDEEGNPVFHRIPESFETAASDGERWRWLLARAEELHPPVADEVRFTLAGFLRAQFGVQTMADYGWFFHRAASEESSEGDTSGTYQLHTLGRDETIARLAIGIRRFTLPDEFNHLAHYQALADTPNSAYAENALDALVEIFNNRRQYPQAMEHLQEAIRRFGPGHTNRRVDLLQQITGNWGQFEESLSRSAGEEAMLQYRFRNGTRARFSAQRVDTPALLEAVKEYLRNNPGQIEWERIQIGSIGAMLMEKHGAKFVRETVAEWTQDLAPLPAHFDRRVSVPTPLQEAGAYLVTARMDDGNTSQIVLWLSDTVLVKKTLAPGIGEKGIEDGGALYFVADARTGAPVPGATVEFFGYWIEHLDRLVWRRHHNIRTTRFAETADADGIVIPSEQDLTASPQQHQWLITATDETGRFAFLGFSHVWRASWHDAQYNETKTYGITDRPVYRPNQNVNFKFWVGKAQYDQDDHSPFAGRSFTVRIRNPRGDEVHTAHFTADEYGGFDGEYPIPDGAPLGMYHIQVDGFGGIGFRVEEYKKPEFEVRIEAPTEPVMLGETIEATIRADYYFGAPVAQARVKYKVLRTPTSQSWYPPAPWDWFYGPGYWWFAYDYDWYPGWHRWGCFRPLPWWIHRPSPPPEIIAENEVDIGEDGTVTVAFDTAVTKAMHGHTDHRYQITAEVTDASRRTILGQGEVLVARRPFKVFAWVNRGFYHEGETVQAGFSARTLDNKPVPGTGRARLLRIRYDEERNPIEDEVEAWDLDVDPHGQASLQLVAAAPGQYRLSFTLTDAKGREEEGGYLFVVRGDAFTDAGYRFARIELVPDRKEYGAGDEVQLAVNTEQEDSTVLLFLRPSNGVYLRPQVLRLEGKSSIVSVPVSRKDMPNFFVEALTVSDGKVHTEVREIVVPPEDRVLEVEVEPDAASYLPGAPATIRVRLRDHLGNAFVGSTVMTVYDKAVEYISGGSNVPDIREFFWKWRRRHNEQTEHSQLRRFWNMVPDGQAAMQALGIFGGTVADEVGADFIELGVARSGMPVDRRGRMAAMESFDDGMVLAEAAPAPAAALKRAEAAPAEPDDALVEAHVRTEFADTAFWAAAIETDDEGYAELTFDMPENLTGWKIRTWTLGPGSRVGEATAEVVTFKNLLLRLQAPRFFVEKDEVVLSANIHNYLDSAKEVRAILELDGEALTIIDEATQTVTVEANGERRVDWRVKVVREGEVAVRMKALTDEESDAMELRYPVYVHGMLKTDSYSGAIRPDEESGGFTIVVPMERRVDQSRLEIRYSPTLAGAMVDALPYLVGYPYGCTEQTLSRFLPTVITHKILKEMGLDLADIREKRANLNAQEIGDDVERARQWQRWDHNPVFDEAEVESMTKEGLKALYDMQLSDGGWGWFSGYGERSGPHTTAYVVQGLLRARASGLAVVPGVLDRGLAWLERYENEQVRRLRDEKKGKTRVDNLDAFVFRVLVGAGRVNEKMREFLHRDRVEHLSVYGKALFALALHDLKDAPGRDALIHNIEQFLVMDDENQTAYLNLPNSGYWWFWYGSEWETHAFYLKLLSATQPDSPKASGLVKYLVNNRKHATYWTSTRDTAVCIEALADYLVASGEMAPELHVEIFIDGEKKKETHIHRGNLFQFDNRLVIEGGALAAGERQVEIRKRGQGPLYYNAYLTNFTLEDFITRAGLEVKVDRFYYRLREVDKQTHVAGARGQAVAQKVEKYEREPIENLGELRSGELVEVELVMESKNDYEYLVFEDMKPAGFEPVNVRSGYDGNAMGAYVEYRDEKVVFFVRVLARGRHSLAYRMRAEIPGRFSALPTRGYAMYAPEIRANSDEIKLIVTD